MLIPREGLTGREEVHSSAARAAWEDGRKVKHGSRDEAVCDTIWLACVPLVPHGVVERLLFHS